MPFVSSMSASKGGRVWPLGAKPDQVPTPSSSSSDKNFTISWSAPSNNGGSPILGYRVQFSTNGGSSWSSPVDAGNVSSYSWTNALNGTSYIGRVLAYNAIGEGAYSSASTSRTPVFASNPTISFTTSTPTTSNRGYRDYTITIDPPNVVSYSYSKIETSTNGAGYVERTTSITNQGSTSYTYTATAGQSIVARVTTYNTDNYSQSATSSTISIPALIDDSYFVDTSNWQAEQDYSAETGTFIITGNSYSNTSGYSIPGVNTANNGDTQYMIQSLRIEAWVPDAGTTICTSSRNFNVDFSGTSTSAGTGGGTISALQAPFSNNSGPTRNRFLSWNVADVGYAFPGAGRIRIRGAGSIGTWSTSPDQRIRAIVYITGKRRTYQVSGYWVYQSY